MANNVVSLSGAKLKVKDISEQISEAFASGLSSLQVNGPIVLKKYAGGTGTGMLRLNHDSPVAYIEYSNDGGTTWQAVGAGDGGGLDWDPATSYVPGDIVLYHAEGRVGMYACTAGTMSVPPGTTAAWRMLTPGTAIYYVATPAQLKSALEAQADSKTVVVLPGVFSSSVSATVATPVTTVYSDEASTFTASLTLSVASGCMVYWHGLYKVSPSYGSVSVTALGAGGVKLSRVVAASGQLTLSGDNLVYEAVDGNVSGGVQELWSTPASGSFVPRNLSGENNVAYNDNLRIYVDGTSSRGTISAGTLASQVADRVPSNTLSIGTVSTLEPGSEATAEITGQSPAQTLSIGIPAGFDGASTYTYVAYASDASGTGFSTTPSAALKYRAEIHTAAAIASPKASDFASAVWVKYLGDDGTPADMDNYYTRSETYSGAEIDQKLAGVASGAPVTLDSYATKADLSDAVAALSADIGLKQDELPPGGAGKYLKSTQDGLVWADVSVSSVDMGGYYTSEEVDALLAGKQEELPIGAVGKYLKKTAAGYEWATPTLGDADNTYDALYDSDVVSSIPASRAVEALNLLCGNMPHMSTKTVVFVPEQDTEAAGMPWSGLDESCAGGPLLVGHAYQLTLWGGLGIYDGHGYPSPAPLTPDGDTDVSNNPGLDTTTVDVPAGYELVRVVEIGVDEFDGKIAGRYIQDDDGVWGSYNIQDNTYHFYNTGTEHWTDPAGEWYAATAPATIAAQEGIVLLDVQYGVFNPDGDPYATPVDTTGWEERAAAALQTFIDAHTVWVLRKKPPKPPDDDDPPGGGGPYKPCGDGCAWWYTWKDITPSGGAGDGAVVDGLQDILLISDFLPTGGKTGDVLTHGDGSDNYSWEAPADGLPPGGTDGQVLKLEDGVPAWGSIEQNIQYVVDGEAVLTIDDELSDSSTNPVQNRAIKKAIDGKLTAPDNGVDGDVLVKTPEGCAWSSVSAAKPYKQDAGTAVTGQPVVLAPGECYIAKTGDEIAVDTTNITAQWGIAWLIVPSEVIDSVKVAQHGGIMAQLDAGKETASLEYDHVQDAQIFHIKHGRHELLIMAGIGSTADKAYMTRLAEA